MGSGLTERPPFCGGMLLPLAQRHGLVMHERRAQVRPGGGVETIKAREGLHMPQLLPQDLRFGQAALGSEAVEEGTP